MENLLQRGQLGRHREVKCLAQCSTAWKLQGCSHHQTQGILSPETLQKASRKEKCRGSGQNVGYFSCTGSPPLPTKSSSLFHIPASSSQPSRFLKNPANLLLPEVTPKQSLTSSGGCPALARIGVQGGGQRGNGRQKGQHSKGRKAWRVGGVEAALYSWGEVSAGAERDLRRKRQGSDHRGLVLHLGGSQ